MRIIKIENHNIKLLNDFISSIVNSSTTFRYFNTRDISIIKNHLTTILLTDDQGKIPFCYGHLESFNGKMWLGICVNDLYVGKGYGKIILNELIKIAKINKVEVISLSVDKDNFNAIKLYEKFNFKKTVEVNNKYFFYQLIIT